MWIKICANTNLEDALLASELGADAVGFVFAASPRQVTTGQVAAIVPHLPKSIEKIGVFSSTGAAGIARIVRETGLTGVQLHGGFDVDAARTLNAELGPDITIIQVLHWTLGEDARSAAEITDQLEQISREPAITRVLIDSKTSSADGGTGRTFDWLAARTAVSGAVNVKIIAAGGLHSGNAAQAIQKLRPWGVDVASGVEVSKGRKDPQKLRQFIHVVRKIF